MPETLDAQVDRLVLEVLSDEIPGLVGSLRALVSAGATDSEILLAVCDCDASPELMRNVAHCVSAIRAEAQQTS